jgi:hypothetical protein
MPRLSVCIKVQICGTVPSSSQPRILIAASSKDEAAPSRIRFPNDQQLPELATPVGTTAVVWRLTCDLHSSACNARAFSFYFLFEGIANLQCKSWNWCDTTINKG